MVFEGSCGDLLRLRRFLLLSFVLAALVAAGCGSTSQQTDGATSGGETTVEQPDQQDQQEEPVKSLEELAKEEGTLTLYTVSAPEGTALLTEAFTQDTGITVEVFRQTGGPLTETFYADHARGETKADVIVHADSSILLTMCEEGLLARYTPPNVDKFPAEAVEALQGCAFPDRLVYFVIAYNTDLVTGEELELLKDDPYEALTDPRFKGQIAIPDPNVNSTSFNHQYMLALLKGGVDSGEIRAYWEALAANEPAFFSSNGPVTDAVISGERKIGVLIENFAAPLIRQGAPIGLIYPNPTLTALAMTGVVENAPHPNAARLYMNWLLSERGQMVLNTVYEIAVPHKDIEDQRTYLTEKDWYEPPKELYFLTDFKKMAEERDKFFAVFNEIFGL